MDRPLEIAFHNLDTSPSAEAEIRQRVNKLAGRYRHLTGCRVSVERLHNQHRTGNVFEVHITLSVPGRDLAVSRQPQKAKQRYANPDLRTSIRDVFDAAERQLESFKGHLREDTSAPTASALTGKVLMIEPGADHGFLETIGGTQLYFHRDSITNASFDAVKEGDVVHYVEDEGDAGPRAIKLRLAEPGER